MNLEVKPPVPCVNNPFLWIWMVVVVVNRTEPELVDNCYPNLFC